MLPDRFILPLVFGAAGGWLSVHQRGLIAKLGNRGGFKDSMILSYDANPGRMEFSERTGGTPAQSLKNALWTERLTP
jgi:hypothetical protein